MGNFRHFKAMSIQGGYPIIFVLNVFHNSHLIQKCIQNQQLTYFLKNKYQKQTNKTQSD